MDLLLLGLIFLMVFSLGRSNRSMNELLHPVLRRWHPARDGSTVRMVGAAFLETVAQPSPAAQHLRATLAQAMRLRTWRVNLMQSCFAEVGLWWTLAIAAVFLNLGGLSVLAVAGFVAVASSLRPRSRALGFLTAAILFAGLFLLLGEAVGRFAAGWRSGETGEWAMLLADNRPGSVLVVTALMTALSVALGLEGLAPALALAGLAIGAVSLNAAVALWWGERLGLALRLQWQGRAQIASVRRLLKLKSISVGSAVPIAWLLLGVLRDFSGLWGGQDQLTSTMTNFLVFTALTTLPFLGTAAVIGHVAEKKPTDDLMERALLPEEWLRSPLLTRTDLADFGAGLRLRLAELERVMDGFTEEEWTKIPPAVRQATAAETLHVQTFLQRVEAHLLSS